MSESEPLDLDYLEMTARDFLGQEAREGEPDVFEEDRWNTQLALIAALRAARKEVEELREAKEKLKTLRGWAGRDLIELLDLRAAHERLRAEVASVTRYIFTSKNFGQEWEEVSGRLRAALEEKSSKAPVCLSTHGGAGWAAGSYRDGDFMVCGICGERILVKKKP